jgi:uncharacterized protein YbbC (DUF1343 family)
LAGGKVLSAQTGGPATVVVGAARMEMLLPLLCDKQVGLVVNHTSRIGQRHLADSLFDIGACVVRIFAPEHGFRGSADAGETIRDGQDIRTGIPIVSLYGKKKKPLPEDFEGLDLIVFDIQDVGARFYTYISTLFYVMEACAEQGKQLIVLDRPNPNAHYVDGPVLDMRLSSFIGIAPLPVVHGCTVGELARLFAGEYWINKAEKLDFRVIPCLNYTHRTAYELPVAPSPNLPNTRSALLYPALCFFEGTEVSVARGTEAPFQMVGHPEYPDTAFHFVPRPGPGSKNPPQQDKPCYGMDFRTMPLDSLRQQNRLNLRPLLAFFETFPHKERFFLENRFFDLLAGNRVLRQQILAGKTEPEIRAAWQPDLDIFKDIRRRYLIYPE